MPALIAFQQCPTCSYCVSAVATSETPSQEQYELALYRMCRSCRKKVIECLKGKLLDTYMSKRAQRAIEAILVSAATRSKRVDVLEWGCGGSTYNYSKFLKSKDIPFSWLGIEHSRLWAEAVAESVPSAQIVLIDVFSNNCKQRQTFMDSYVDYPASTGAQFDLIMVDGRKRRRCLLQAAKLLKPQGIVMLHDSTREYYHPAMEAYKYGIFDGVCWFGSHDISSEELRNLFSYASRS